jgi:hypothetical protein
MVLIAYHLLGGRIGAYLDWLANGLKMAAKTLNIRMHY